MTELEMFEAMSEGFSQEPSRDDPMPHYLQRQRNALAAIWKGSPSELARLLSELNQQNRTDNG
jgi:hypothetical protein